MDHTHIVPKSALRNEVEVGKCPRCGAPLHSLRVAMMVGPIPATPSCNCTEAQKVAAEFRERQERNKPIWEC